MTLLEAGSAPFERALGAELGARLADRYRDHGVDIHTDTAAAGFRETSAGRVDAVILRDGTVIESDVVLVAVGVEPAHELGRTAEPPVYACGDNAGSRGHWTGAAAEAVETARRLLGLDPLPQQPPFFWSDQFGLRLQLVGDTHSCGRDRGRGLADSFVARYRASGGSSSPPSPRIGLRTSGGCAWRWRQPPAHVMLSGWPRSSAEQLTKNYGQNRGIAESTSPSKPGGVRVPRSTEQEDDDHPPPARPDQTDRRQAERVRARFEARQRRDSPPARVSARRPAPVRADDRARAASFLRAPARRARHGARRRSCREARPRPQPPDQGALAREPAESRSRPGVHSRARRPHRSRRADEWARSARAGDVLRARLGGHRPWRDGLPLVARPVRGAARRGSGRPHSRRTARARRYGRQPARPGVHDRGSDVRRAPTVRGIRRPARSAPARPARRRHPLRAGGRSTYS